MDPRIHRTIILMLLYAQLTECQQQRKVGANKDLISSQYSSSESTHQDTSKDAVNEDVVEPEAHNVLAVSTENKHMNEKYREPGQDNDDLLEDTAEVNRSPKSSIGVAKLKDIVKKILQRKKKEKLSSKGSKFRSVRMKKRKAIRNTCKKDADCKDWNKTPTARLGCDKKLVTCKFKCMKHFCKTIQSQIGCESKWDCQVDDQGCAEGKCIPGILDAPVRKKSKTSFDNEESGQFDNYEDESSNTELKKDSNNKGKFESNEDDDIDSDETIAPVLQSKERKKKSQIRKSKLPRKDEKWEEIYGLDYSENPQEIEHELVDEPEIQVEADEDIG